MGGGVRRGWLRDLQEQAILEQDVRNRLSTELLGSAADPAAAENAPSRRMPMFVGAGLAVSGVALIAWAVAGGSAGNGLTPEDPFAAPASPDPGLSPAPLGLPILPRQSPTVLPPEPSSTESSASFSPDASPPSPSAGSQTRAVVLPSPPQASRGTASTPSPSPRPNATPSQTPSPRPTPTPTPEPATLQLTATAAGTHVSVTASEGGFLLNRPLEDGEVFTSYEDALTVYLSDDTAVRVLVNGVPRQDDDEENPEATFRVFRASTPQGDVASPSATAELAQAVPPTAQSSSARGLVAEPRRQGARPPEPGDEETRHPHTEPQDQDAGEPGGA